MSKHAATDRQHLFDSFDSGVKIATAGNFPKRRVEIFNKRYISLYRLIHQDLSLLIFPFRTGNRNLTKERVIIVTETIPIFASSCGALLQSESPWQGRVGRPNPRNLHTSILLKSSMDATG